MKFINTGTLFYSSIAATACAFIYFLVEDASKVRAAHIAHAVATPAASDSGAGFGVFLLILFGVCAYFFPAIVAFTRGVKAANGILVVDLFLGWTFIGWVVALAWAVSAEPEPRTLATPPPA